MAKLEKTVTTFKVKELENPIVFPAWHGVEFSQKKPDVKSKRIIKMNSDYKWAFMEALFKHCDIASTSVPWPLRLIMAIIALAAKRENCGKKTLLEVRQYDLFDLTVWQPQWVKERREEYWRASVEALRYIEKRMSVIRNHNGEYHKWITLRRVPSDRKNLDDCVSVILDYSPLLRRKGNAVIPAPNNKAVFGKSLEYVGAYSKWRAYWLLHMMAERKMYAPLFSRKELADMLQVGNSSYGAKYFSDVAEEIGLEAVKVPSKYLRPRGLKFVRNNTV